MARSDLLINIVKAGRNNDQALLRQTVTALAADERAMRHGVLADRLIKALGPAVAPGSPAAGVSVTEYGGMVYVGTTPRRLDGLDIAPQVRDACQALVREQDGAERLRSHGLEPRHRILLAGPPGNGKTSLAEALATEIGVPFLVVRYDEIFKSMLGETGGRLRKLFDLARRQRCVLFFDEFETIGKERGDAHEVGEIKRTVSGLLLHLDSLPSDVIVVAATNHAGMLDRAAWRRFQIRLELGPPTLEQRQQWIDRLQDRLGTPLGPTPRELAESLPATSFSELEQFCEDVLRGHVLALPGTPVESTVRTCLDQWKSRAQPAP